MRTNISKIYQMGGVLTNYKRVRKKVAKCIKHAINYNSFFCTLFYESIRYYGIKLGCC